MNTAATPETTDAADTLPRTLAGFRGRHAGQCIVVCGCGSSLHELPQPNGLVTIGVNDVGRLFDPTYLVVINPRSQFSGERFRHVEQSRARAIFTQLDLGLRHPHVVRFGLGRRGGTDFDRDDVVDYTSNSPYVAALLAIRMGAARVALIGVDFTDHHFFGRTGRHPLERRFTEIDRDYGRLAEAAAARGVEIVNASSTSRLTSLKRVPAASLVAAEKPAPPRLFFVNYRFLACGDVFATGLARAADSLGIPHASAWWDDPQLPAKVSAFDPDLTFVVHGRRAAQRHGTALRSRRSAVWLLDEPYEVDDTARWSSTFSDVFVNDPATLDRHKQAHLLPVCFDPVLHADRGVARDYRVGFVGGYNPVREKYLVRLASEGLLSYVVGGPWRAPALERLRLSTRTTPDDTARLYQRTELVINVFRSVHHYNRLGTIGTSLNPRVFEALACGALVVSEPRPALTEIFPEVPTFTGDDDLVEIVRRLLADPEERARRLAACRARLHAHDYASRLAEVLRVTFGVDRPVSPKENVMPAPVVPQPATPAEAARPRAAQAPSSRLPEAWTPSGGTVVNVDDTIRLTALPGEEAGIATARRFASVFLAFDVQLHGQCSFIAKIHHAEQGGRLANSYHLIATPTHTCLARHDAILASFRLSRSSFQRVEMTWHDGVLTVRVNDDEVCRVNDRSLPEGHAFLGVSNGSVSLRNVQIGEPLTGATVPGWLVRGSGSLTVQGDRLILSAAAGPIDLVSEKAANDVELECSIRFDANAHVALKLHQQAADDSHANSYHLICRPGQSYIARHNHVFARVSPARGPWQRLRLRWVDQCLELFIDDRLRARVADNFLQSGYSVLSVAAGRAELRGLTLRDLPDPPAVAIRPTLAYGRNEAPPFDRTPVRNLLYHVWPVRGSMWRWNVGQLLERIDLFNGRRIIGIVHDARSEDPAEVRQLLEGHGCEFLTEPNEPTGEGLTFPKMLDEIRSMDPNEVTFYGHAKGVKYEPDVPDPVRRWASTQYTVNLNDWRTVRAQLSKLALTGAFKMLGRFRAHQYAGDWHYSGTFFWMRHSAVFGRDVGRIPSFYGGVEAWPGIHFRRHETGCLFMDNLRQLPYRPEFWRDAGDRALTSWIDAHPAMPPPASLQHPVPIDGHAGPRLEQHPAEFDWFLERLTAAGPASILTIGCMEGGVEWHIARVFRSLGRDIAITAVDVAARPELVANIERARREFKQRIDLVVGDSTAAATRAALDQQYDAVFIDGDHGYRGARADLDFALSRGPRIVGVHDIVDSDWHASARCAVSRVWREARNQFRTEERTTADWGGVGVLYP